MSRGLAFVVGGLIGVFFGLLVAGGGALVWVVAKVVPELGADDAVSLTDCRAALPLSAVADLGFDLGSAQVRENVGGCEFVPHTGGISIQVTDYAYDQRSGRPNATRTLARATEECADPLFGPPADYQAGWLGLDDETFGCVTVHEDDRFGRAISVLVLDPSATEVITIDISQPPRQVSATQGWRGPVAEIVRSSRESL